MQFIDEVLAGHDNGNPRVVMGDFNTVPESDELRWLTGQHTLGGRRVAYQDAWAAVRQDTLGYTWTRANDYTEKMHWLRRDRRLDYIFVTPVRRDRRATVRAAASPSTSRRCGRTASEFSPPTTSASPPTCSFWQSR